MKKLLFFSAVLWTFLSTAQSVRNEILVPVIPGYEVLKCDFHMHTVFSDGTVWPTVRAGEAWQEGLDAIAITDHLEYTPNKEYVPVSHGTPYVLAEKTAAGLGLILIKGVEITKSMPPGHFNALFVKDEAKIHQEDYRAALREAKAQGAFVLWNHPGWKAQAPNGAVWMPEHEELFREGLFNGIEVVNHYEWYPEVLGWSRDKNLTVFANSDVHDPILNFLKQENLERRPITLVFATERSPEGIREALQQGRTVGWFRNLLLGKTEWLETLFLASVSQRIITAGEKTTTLQLTNLSDFAFEFAESENPEKVTLLPARSSVILKVPRTESGTAYQVRNLLPGPGEPVTIKLPLN
ncbi:MAG: hypothetical protein WBK43_00440 [Prolixibacteraceae bacterium]|jgi:hypothetical protein|nr:hypothetical protein [Prolixibacteraceae bacterium]MDI9564214.1 PHP domain-containing protein [Bacteroidota bacterium]NLS99495.1 histidinol-phosphatase [Bacteroidales bacterium]OQB81459.1 MAG: hypothetical protein BWX87_00725 [Bacteroidetes bacterium ADurb.Bin123]HNU77160.1 PHP domain-containing protein [Prolixibacteraceae bacterium]